MPEGRLRLSVGTMSHPTPQRPLQVVIAGGGIAGLETLLALRDLADDRVELTLVAAGPDFFYKPLVVGEPFAAAHADRLALEPIARNFGARFVEQAVSGVLPDRHVIALASGDELSYDVLVVCVGAQSRPAYRRALTFDTKNPLELNGILADLDGGYSKHITFMVPPGATWALPIYELALMTERQTWGMGLDDVRYTVVTPETEPLAIFGKAASSAIAALLARRGIDVITGSYAREDDEGTFVLVPGDRTLDVGRAVALPVSHGPHVPGLPSGDDGFIPIDDHSRVRGLDDVYAAGDGTNFPIKQGGIATQQADAAAEHIAARAGAPLDAQPFRPVLRGKLLTGDKPLYIRHDVRGGAGDDSASDDHLWWPPHKVSGRYLAPWLARETGHSDPEPPTRPLEVEVKLPQEWHRDPMAIDPYGPMDGGPYGGPIDIPPGVATV